MDGLYFILKKNLQDNIILLSYYIINMLYNLTKSLPQKALNEPDGTVLTDYYSKKSIGLNLVRFGGFYWKFVVNEDWSDLKQGDNTEFTLIGRYYSLTPDRMIFQNVQIQF